MSGTLSPIHIGYCLSLTGPVAGNTRSARLAQDIWREVSDVSAWPFFVPAA
jgi:branched-chain amino acid transport system substrate-binding protein